MCGHEPCTLTILLGKSRAHTDNDLQAVKLIADRVRSRRLDMVLDDLAYCAFHVITAYVLNGPDHPHSHPDLIFQGKALEQHELLVVQGQFH